MGPHLDFDLGGDLVLDDARDDARQPIADRLPGGRAAQGRTVPLDQVGGSFTLITADDIARNAEAKSKVYEQLVKKANISLE